MGPFVPEIPVDFPQGTRISVGKVETRGDVEATRVRGIVQGTSGEALRQDLRAQLVADGWTVAEPAPSTLAGTRGAQSVTLTLEDDGDGSYFTLLWTVPAPDRG